LLTKVKCTQELIALLTWGRDDVEREIHNGERRGEKTVCATGGAPAVDFGHGGSREEGQNGDGSEGNRFLSSPWTGTARGGAAMDGCRAPAGESTLGKNGVERGSGEALWRHARGGEGTAGRRDGGVEAKEGEGTAGRRDDGVEARGRALVGIGESRPRGAAALRQG
jgi:hypothetical protein